MVAGVTEAGTPLGSFTAAASALCTTGRQLPNENEVMPGMNCNGTRRKNTALHTANAVYICNFSCPT